MPIRADRRRRTSHQRVRHPDPVGGRRDDDRRRSGVAEQLSCRIAEELRDDIAAAAQLVTDVAAVPQLDLEVVVVSVEPVQLVGDLGPIHVTASSDDQPFDLERQLRPLGEELRHRVGQIPPGKPDVLLALDRLAHVVGIPPDDVDAVLRLSPGPVELHLPQAADLPRHPAQEKLKALPGHLVSRQVGEPGGQSGGGDLCWTNHDRSLQHRRQIMKRMA
ncbi:MAG TPA: hypothetical protein VG497_21195 [Kribbella sp.]|nr:hypothetical protein [Kribbella sp.]